MDNRILNVRLNQIALAALAIFSLVYTCEFENKNESDNKLIGSTHHVISEVTNSIIIADSLLVDTPIDSVVIIDRKKLSSFQDSILLDACHLILKGFHRKCLDI